MNEKIKKYFESIELLLLNSEIIESYEIMRQDISDIDGKIRIKVELTNNDTVDLFEYLEINNNKITIKKYHHHWQTKDNTITCRWDNAPHHKELGGFPHHLHTIDKVESVNKIPDIKYIIKTIERKCKEK